MLRVYEGCMSPLRDELGATPAPELRALQEQLLRLLSNRLPAGLVQWSQHVRGMGNGFTPSQAIVRMASSLRIDTARDDPLRGRTAAGCTRRTNLRAPLRGGSGELLCQDVSAGPRILVPGDVPDSSQSMMPATVGQSSCLRAAKSL